MRRNRQHTDTHRRSCPFKTLPSTNAARLRYSRARGGGIIARRGTSGEHLRSAGEGHRGERKVESEGGGGGSEVCDLTNRHERDGVQLEQERAPSNTHLDEHLLRCSATCNAPEQCAVLSWQRGGQVRIAFTVTKHLLDVVAGGGIHRSSTGSKASVHSSSKEAAENFTRN